MNTTQQFTVSHTLIFFLSPFFFMSVETKMLLFLKCPIGFYIVSYLQAAAVIEHLAWYHSSWDVHFWSHAPQDSTPTEVFAGGRQTWAHASVVRCSSFQ